MGFKLKFDSDNHYDEMKRKVAEVEARRKQADLGDRLGRKSHEKKKRKSRSTVAENLPSLLDFEPIDGPVPIVGTAVEHDPTIPLIPLSHVFPMASPLSSSPV